MSGSSAVSSDVRIGVFVCHCGTNIGGFLDVPALTEYAKTLQNVVYAKDNLYTCSDAGLNEIGNAIREKELNRVIVAACTPRTHEPLFRSVCKDAGLNPYLFEFVNIRDQCSWVHMRETETANEKARDLIRMGVARAGLLEPQEEFEVDVTPIAMVIGGGVSGMTSSLSLANQGFEVKLVERKERLGGYLNRLNVIHPSNIEASELSEKLTDQVRANGKIEVLTSAEVKEIDGFVGNYKIAVTEKGELKEFDVGTIIVATGAETLIPEGLYGYNGKTVITQLEFEELLKAGNFDASNVVMIQCVGSRIEERPYCSKICCMNAIKNALLIKESSPDASVYVLYRDIQAHGTRNEEHYREARERGVVFIKYSSEREPTVEGKNIRVYDELLGEKMTLPADLVVLSTATVAHGDTKDLAQMLKVPTDENGFFLEAHVKLRPVDFATDGLYLCGSARFPSDIAESISQAYAAASRASVLLSAGRAVSEPIIAVVNEDDCTGCDLCEMNCPYKAIRVQETDKGRIAKVVDVSCKGCGMCGAGCPHNAITMAHYNDQQIIAQIRALAEGGS